MKTKRFISIFLSMILFFSITSCKKVVPVYLDILPATELTKEAREELETTNFRVAPSDWLADYVSLPDGMFDYEICFSSDGSNINEFGIWHVRQDQVAVTEAALRTYLSESLRKNREFYNSYIPEETVKLEKAEVKVFGNYVCYAILNEHDKNIFFSTIQEELQEKD